MNIINLLLFRSYVSGTANGSDAAIVTAGIGFAILMFVLALICIAGRVLLAFAAYNDARAKSNPDAVMWGILIGFFGLIPGIIYLCVRNSGRNFIVCQNCGFSHYFGDMNCPKCGAPNQTPQYVNPFAAQQAHKAKVQLTVALVLLGIGVVAAIIGIFVFAANVISYAGGTICY